MSDNIRNPLAVSTASEDDISVTSVDLRTSLAKKPSQAYLESKMRNSTQRETLEKKGIGALDYEFKDHDDETADIPVDLRQSTTITPIQKLRKIGKKTVCMAICLMSFGFGMVVSALFLLFHKSRDGGREFVLFFLIGLCAIIPGTYASYNVLGKYLGWWVIDN
jgi:hypothetical protein